MVQRSNVICWLVSTEKVSCHGQKRIVCGAAVVRFNQTTRAVTPGVSRRCLRERGQWILYEWLRKGHAPNCLPYQSYMLKDAPSSLILSYLSSFSIRLGDYGICVSDSCLSIECEDSHYISWLGYPDFSPSQQHQKSWS